MSTPFHLRACLGEPYDHGRFLMYEVGDIQGMLESIRRGIEDHARHFPEDKVNARYLNGYARRISHLEDEVDSWVYWAFQLPEEDARKKLQTIRNKVFRISTEMGPAAEAHYWSIVPAWQRPRTVTPWRVISETRLKRLVRELKEAKDQLRGRCTERMYLSMLRNSNQQLELLDLKTKEVLALKEQLQQAVAKKDAAVVRARLAERQAAQDEAWYEEQLAAADLAQEQAAADTMRVCQEKQQIQQRQAELEIINLCLHLKDLTI